MTTSDNATDKPGRTGLGERTDARVAIVGALFFLTGATGLIYQVVWMRQLIYVFGATIYAVSAVVAAFMGGLALGSWLAGKWADSLRKPLGIYGLLEALVSVAALAFPLGLHALDPIFQWLYGYFGHGGALSFDVGFYFFSLCRFVLIFLLLLIPTTLMGASLPVLSRYVARRSASIGRRVGALYALNTFGAVVGCFASGFLLIEALGIRKTTLLAVGINFLVAVVAVWISSKERPIEDGAATEEPAARDAQAPATTGVRPHWVSLLVLWTYGVSGGVGLAYEVIWSRALVFAMDILKNTTYAFTAMLTVFLVGLAGGGALMARLVDRQRDPLRLYGLVQLLIGLGGALSFYVIFHRAGDIKLIANALNFETGRVIWLAEVVNTFWKTIVAIFLPTLMMGMAFPLAARLYVSGARQVGGGVGRLYAVNTVGAIIGSFLGGFVIIPLLGMGRGIMALAALNMAIGVVVLVANPAARQGARVVWGVIGAAALIVIGVRLPPPNQPFQRLGPFERMVFYEEGPLGTVSVVRNLMGHKTIYVDNVGVAGTDPILLTDQKSLAHVPVLFLEKPRSALTVGFGSGGASHSYCLYDFMERIHCVEICKTVLKAAPDLASSNHHIISFAKPDRSGPPIARADVQGRYDIKFDDVRGYLRFSDQRYDVIATDCTDLDYKSNANLYDLEYFQLCADRLTSGGMVVVWMPLGGLSEDAFRVALRTFHRVFPEHMSVWYMNNEPTHYILLIGSRTPLRIDLERMKERMADPDVAADLAELGLNDPYKILSCFVVDQRGLGDYLAGDLLNTEDRPYLEFEAPRYGFGQQPLLENLERLWRLRNDVAPHLAPPRAGKEGWDVDLLARYFAAADFLVKGHGAQRNLDVEGATRFYLAAREACPTDRSIGRLLEFQELQLRLLNQPDDLWGLTMFGRSLLLQGRHAEAMDRLRHAARIADAMEAELPGQAGGGVPNEALRAVGRLAREGLRQCQEQIATKNSR